MIPRLYLSLQFFPSVSIPLSAPHYHYLAHVLRLKPGAEVQIFNGSQGLWRALLDKTFLVVQECIQAQPKAPQQLDLFFSPIKQQGWLVEKSTELGVTGFDPILCQRTVVRHFSKERHEKISWEACEQSHRLDVPHFSPLVSLSQRLSCLEGGLCIALDPTAPTPMRDFPSCEIQGLFIGPEGGWTSEELALFDHTPDLKRAHMGSLILRAETAAIACVSFIQIGSRT
jgi:16S rRNA (uracil1498-N3)-methyltransferase